MMSKQDIFLIYDLPASVFREIEWPGKTEPFLHVSQRWTAMDYMPWTPVAHLWRAMIARIFRQSGAAFQTPVMFHYRIEGLMNLEATAFWPVGGRRMVCVSNVELDRSLSQYVIGRTETPLP